MVSKRPEWWIERYSKDLEKNKDIKGKNFSGVAIMVENTDKDGIPFEKKELEWYLNICSNEYIVGDRSLFFNVEPTYKVIIWGDRHIAKVKGSVRLHCDVDGAEIVNIIFNVYYLPGWSKNILSFGKMKEKGTILRYENILERYYF